MKHFYLIKNPEKAGADEVAGDICRYIESHGGFCRIRGKEEAQVRQTAEMGSKGAAEMLERVEAGTERADICRKQPHFQYTNACRVPKDTECVITLGGDGTLIQAARDLAGRQIPMVGVNLGNLGYLTQIGRQEDVKGLLEALLNGQYQLEHRMMLKGSIFHEGAVVKEDLALNEIVITRREALRVLKFRIYVNGEYLSQYRADGMIAATPTGSTAYNLSAGGPIVEPNARMMILTPICPHDLNGRSIVLSAQDVVEIEALGNDDAGQVAVFDGDMTIYMKVGDRLRVERSEVETVLVKLKNISFLDNLRSKLAGI